METGKPRAVSGGAKVMKANTGEIKTIQRKPACWCELNNYHFCDDYLSASVIMRRCIR